MAPKRRAPKSKVDRLEVGCAACCGQYCRSNPYNNALCCSFMLMWVATLILWFGGAYFSGFTSSSSTSPGTNALACSNRTLSVGFGSQNPYVWWISSSGIIVIITVIASCLYCCSFLGAFCPGLPRAAAYVSSAGLLLALLAYGVFLAWVGVGTYLAANVTTAASCVSYIFYLIFFYLCLLTLIVCGVTSVAWKVHVGGGKGGEGRKGEGTSIDKKLLTSMA